MRTYTIELRCDFQDEEKYELVLEIVREKAREMLTTAIMLKDKRDPQISFSSGDMFETDKDLTILTPEDLEATGGE
jgi:hypothetical protein